MATTEQSQTTTQFLVRLFAAAKQTLQSEVAVVQLCAPCTASRLQTHLAEQYPKIAALILQSRIAINAAYASPDQQITTADEIALIPPVSGG